MTFLCCNENNGDHVDRKICYVQQVTFESFVKGYVLCLWCSYIVYLLRLLMTHFIHLSTVQQQQQQLASSVFVKICVTISCNCATCSWWSVVGTAWHSWPWSRPWSPATTVARRQRYCFEYGEKADGRETRRPQKCELATRYLGQEERVRSVLDWYHLLGMAVFVAEWIARLTRVQKTQVWISLKPVTV